MANHVDGKRNKRTRRENDRLLQRVNLLEKQLKAEQELNAKQWKRLNEAETYIQRRLSEHE